MKKRGKKLLSYLLALVLVLGLMPALAVRADGRKAISIHLAIAEDRTYEPGNKNVTIRYISFKDKGNGKVLALDKKEYKVTGIMESDTAGDNKTVNVTVKLKNPQFYIFYGGGHTDTASTTVNITKATPTTGDFTYEATTSLEYDGTEKTANVTSDKTGMGKITVGYYSDEECKTPVTPTAVGTYYVAIDVGEGTNYSAASRLHDPSWTFTITEATPPTGDFDFTEPTSSVDMFRLYNPNTGEHFYTGNLSEKDSLINEGWNYEGVAWNAPDFSLTPVYRLYDKNAGTHRYTMDEDKRDGFIAEGWSDEGIGWYSDGNETIPVFGLYNKNALQAGAYHFTADTSERDNLIELGWRDEGIGWYGLGEDAA